MTKKSDLTPIVLWIHHASVLLSLFESRINRIESLIEDRYSDKLILQVL